jgi:hypothetical protein
MTDPFSIEECPKSLINIATSLHASKEVEESLLGSIGRCAKAANSFIKDTTLCQVFKRLQLGPGNG